MLMRISDADYSIFLPLTSPLPNAPGSVDYFLSVAMMWRVTTLLGCVWVVADLVQDTTMAAPDLVGDRAGRRLDRAAWAGAESDRSAR